MDEAHPDDGGTPLDPGAARERTALAWNRSGLALLVAVAIMLRRLWPLQGRTTFVVLIALGVGCAMWATGMLMTHRSRLDVEGAGMVSATTCRMLTVGTLLLAAAGFLLGLLSHP
jgi:uncharacterized membrane protein YidH (DUF202 family)